MSVVEVRELSLVKNKNVILKDISLKIEKGSICGLVGRNGSGKTMLMKCICGFIKPTSGEVYVWEKCTNKDTSFPDNMGIIIETPGFVPYYSGYKNLAMLAGIKGLISPKEVKDAMRFVGLDPNAKKHVGKYSLGMRQRLGLAQAIMERPELLVLDEPFNGLDQDGVNEMRKSLIELRSQGRTIILASHSKEDIEMLCDRVFYMNHGMLSEIN